MPSVSERLIRRARRAIEYVPEDAPIGPLYDVSEDPGPFIEDSPELPRPIIHPHLQQREVRAALERFILVLAGTRGGKTALGPWWMLDEMEERGPGEYLVCAPSYPLFKKGAYKAIRRVFVTLLQLGTIVGGPSGEFYFSEEGFQRIWPGRDYDDEAKIVFAHAGNPDSLEAAEYKAAWLDEPGQRGFPVESWEAIQRRLAIDEGRALLTTTPYMTNHWIVSEIHDPWKRRGSDAERPEDKHCRVVSFESRSNPAFPMAEWDRAKAVLPTWKFDLFYRGLLTRPAGLIYDCIDDNHILPGKDFAVPEGWPIYCGIDFGAPNFAAVFLYENMEEVEGPVQPGAKPKLKKTGQYVAFAEYRPNESKTSKDHVAAMRAIIGRNPNACIGGAASEGQWRAEFAAAGWPIHPPDQREVEVGIARTYAAFAENRLFIMDSCPMLLEELRTYSREVDEHGTPISDTIMDQHNYHGADSLRYSVSWMERKTSGVNVILIKGE